MNKKLIYLIAAIAVLGILSALYLYGSNNSEDDSEIISETESNTIMLLNDKNVSEINIKNTLSDYTVYIDNGSYFVKGYEKNSFSENNLKHIFTSFSAMQALASVEENVSDFSKFGLDNPSATAIIKGNEQNTIYVGDITADNKYYYIRKNNENNVYMVQKNYGEILLSDMKDLIEKNVSSIAAANVNYLDIKEKGKAEILINSDNNNETLKNYVSTSGLTAMIMQSPLKNAIVYPTNLQDEVLCDLSSMMINEVIEFNPTDLSKYGLDDPTKEITVKDSSKELKLNIGEKCDDNSVYFMIEGKPEVYTIENSALSAFNNINIMDFIQNFVSLYSRSNVNKITIKAENKEHIVEFRTEGENKIAVDEEGVRRDNRNSYIDGKLIPKETFSDFYEAVAGINFDSVAAGNVSGEPVAVIEYSLVDGSVDRINYYNYNDNFYCTENDGDNMIMIVNKQQITQLMQYAERLTN